MKNILDYYKKSPLIFDGGTGSVLQEKGLLPGVLPETWNIEKPEIITDLHYNYYLAGSNIVNTNTFGAFSTKFAGGTSYSLKQIIDAAFKNLTLARQKIIEHDKEQGLDTPRFISFDIGSCGKLLKPLGELEFEECINLYKETFSLALPHKPDLLTIETINDLYEAKAIILAAKETMDALNIKVPILLSFVFDENAKTLTGSTPEICIELAQSLGVDIIGTNCSLGPKQMQPIVNRMLDYATIPVCVKPNAGLPKSVDGKTVYDVTEDEFADFALDFCKSGAFIIGGCCGTNFSYIKNLSYKIKNHLEKNPYCIKENHTRSVITSSTKLVEFGKRCVLIGERINPTGKKKLKEALKEKNISYILGEAVTQQEKGAEVLDINVGLPEIDECQMMQTVIKEVQSVTDLPLQIDTSDIKTMEKALRIYNGKPLINSVNAKEENMKQVFPLVKKYGGMIVCLTLDETGIPPFAKDRITLAKKLYDTAFSYGIKKEDIIIDPLAMTVSADSFAAVNTLETVKYIKEQLNGLTSLGVSNVSFGLPLREHITSVFFTMAMQNGLSAAIMNPSAKEMIKAYKCFNTLSGLDNQCLEYIDFASSYEKEVAQNAVKVSNAATTKTNENGTSASVTSSNSATSQDDPLIKAILKGLKDNAKTSTQFLLLDNNGSALTPIQIIDTKIIPALDIIGRDFENKISFLPQLLMAAEAAKVSFDVIKDHLQKSGLEEKKVGTVVIATVKGDIHDIGKNIVKVLLENYSFNVIDLGKDVPPETVLDAVIKHHAPLAGLSALMTTTVGAMEDTIKLIHQKAPWCKVFVGGAVLTQEYADQIHADKYTKDATESVKYCQSVCC